MTLADLEEMRLFIIEHLLETMPFDIVMESEIPEDDQKKAIFIVQRCLTT